jgi:hypothetical protein
VSSILPADRSGPFWSCLDQAADVGSKMRGENNVSVSITKESRSWLSPALIVASIAVTAATAAARANVITDWDEKAAAVLSSMPA